MGMDPAKLTLEQWCDKFLDANPGYWADLDAGQAWLRFVEIAASIAEQVRTEEYAEMATGLGKAIGWLCSFVKVYSKKTSDEQLPLLSETLSEMFWRKYPGTCYRCTHELAHTDIIEVEKYLPCVCLVVPKVPNGVKELREFHLTEARQRKRKPTWLDEWANMIKDIYGPNHRQLSISAIALHFVEEVGEVAADLRKLRDLGSKQNGKREHIVAELQEEIADVFSWLLGLLNKLDQAFEGSRLYYKTLKKQNLPPLKASSIAAVALERWKGEQLHEA